MTERIKEQLSAFLDGELPEPESALLLKRLERDDELRGALSRYSLIGAVLRSDGDVPAARQVAARVSAAIAREPAPGGIGIRWHRRRALARSAAGLGIAASVATAAIMLAPSLGTQVASEPAAVVAAQQAEAPVLPVAEIETPAPDAGVTYTTPPAADAAGGLPPAELANYLVAHYGYASPLVRRSVVAGLIAEPGVPAAVEAAAAAELPPGP
ncbi:MAG TPA: RseA family anti-sigma factor [Steroidobacteraceae bacterium]|nr:RseA family anti-sigma factor [Steroidobacteraceae bacterium]